MRKEISPEMYNYNKFPGPSFVAFENQVKSDNHHFILIENIKDAFQVESFSQRFSEILLKYDYIVGDWGNEQLRLKGFYKDNKEKVKRQSKISRLEDYIMEYCNFGCAYFVLENPEPVEIVFEEERLSKSKKTKDKRDKKRKQFSKKIRVQEEKARREKVKKQEHKREIRDATQHFVIRKKN